MLVTVLVFDRGERLMRPLAGGRVVKLNVVQLRAADDSLLLLSREGMPRFKVVHVLLYDNVAAAGGGCVLLGDEDRGGHGGTDGVGRAINESEEVANVEVAEADGLVDDRNSVAQQVHQLPLELKA